MFNGLYSKILEPILKSDILKITNKRFSSMKDIKNDIEYYSICKLLREDVTTFFYNQGINLDKIDFSIDYTNSIRNKPILTAKNFYTFICLHGVYPDPREILKHDAMTLEKFDTGKGIVFLNEDNKFSIRLDQYYLPIKDLNELVLLLNNQGININNYKGEITMSTCPNCQKRISFGSANKMKKEGVWMHKFELGDKKSTPKPKTKPTKTPKVPNKNNKKSK